MNEEDWFLLFIEEVDMDNVAGMMGGIQVALDSPDWAASVLSLSKRLIPDSRAELANFTVELVSALPPIPHANP